MNVDKLKIIQVGISFADENGYLPQGTCTWQFNFKFDLKSFYFFYILKLEIYYRTDEYAKDAIDLLSNSGINFTKHQTQGINPAIFAEYLISSGWMLH